MNEVRKPLSAVLTFKNEDGGNVTITINPVRDDLEGSDLEAVMDTIIAENCFTSKGGDLVEKVKATIVDIVVETYDMTK